MPNWGTLVGVHNAQAMTEQCDLRQPEVVEEGRDVADVAAALVVGGPLGLAAVDVRHRTGVDSRLLRTGEQGLQGSHWDHVRHATPRDTRSPRSRIFSSVTRSCTCSAARSVRSPRQTSRNSSCNASDRMVFGATN